MFQARLVFSLPLLLNQHFLQEPWFFSLEKPRSELWVYTLLVSPQQRELGNTHMWTNPCVYTYVKLFLYSRLHTHWSKHGSVSDSNAVPQSLFWLSPLTYLQFLLWQWDICLSPSTIRDGGFPYLLNSVYMWNRFRIVNPYFSEQQIY